MSNSPLRDWFGRTFQTPRPVNVTVLDEHGASRAPGNFGTVGREFADPFQSLSSTQENNLLVTMFSAFDAVVTLTGMIHRPGNQFTPIGPNGAGFNLNVKGDRTIYQFACALGSSIAIASLNAVVSSATTNIPVNACWVIVQQTRPMPDGTTAITATLLSGPVTLLQPLAYPGSPVQKTSDSTGFTRLIDVAAPAPGVEISIPVPTGARWQPNTLHFKLLTDAVVASREVLLRYTSATTDTAQTELMIETQGTLQPASTLCQYAYGFTLPPTVSSNFGSGANSTTRQTGLPGNRFLQAGEQIVTQTSGLDPGDQYQGIVLGVTEVLDPLSIPALTVDYLVVAGGGGGSKGSAVARGAGGGGAGGVLTGSRFLLRGAVLPVVIGGGGAAAANPNQVGTNGNNSSLDTLLAFGGGGGGSSDAGALPAVGGSGGGAGDFGGVFAAGGNTDGQGNAGGRNSTSAGTGGSGGGGGGATGVGANGVAGGVPAPAGGAGLVSTISGFSVTYATGGSGGGDAGGVGANGAANRGDGGGGGGGNGPNAGGNGGSGIVIVRYLTGTLTATGGTITTAGPFTVHTFTVNGTFTVQ